MDRELFGKDETVRSRLRRTVLCRLWTYGRPGSERWAKLLKERFGTSAIPFWAILSPADEELSRFTFAGGSTAPLAERFRTGLDAALARFPGR